MTTNKRNKHRKTSMETQKKMKIHCKVIIKNRSIGLKAKKPTAVWSNRSNDIISVIVLVLL